MAVSPKEKLYPDNTIPYKDGFLKVAHEQFSEGISQILLCTAEGVLDSHVTYLVHLLDVSLVNGFQSDDCSSMLEALRRAPPGLVRILDYEVADHCIIAIQEWQDGDSFCQSPEQLLGVDEVNVHEIAQSLEWFHRIHPAAMHGRVSPGHCLIRDGRLKLHSPMYSVLLLKEMCSDAVMGTLKISELPPELLLSNRELKRCPIDGYGLGLLLYATLTGQILIEEGSEGVKIDFLRFHRFVKNWIHLLKLVEVLLRIVSEILAEFLEIGVKGSFEVGVGHIIVSARDLGDRGSTEGHF